MALRVTVDIFSGRPNPVFEVNEDQAEALLKRAQPLRSVRTEEARALPVPTLGYRGLIVEQVGRRITQLPREFRIVYSDAVGPAEARRAEVEDLEDYLFGPKGIVPEGKLGGRLAGFLRREIRRSRQMNQRFAHGAALTAAEKAMAKRGPAARAAGCRTAPVYEPQWWNDGALRQRGNNCYNYSTNHRTDSFAQPGRAAGSPYTSFTCASVRPAAIRDSLVDAPAADNRCPQDGHLVALVVASGFDFHWYRKGRDGLWTHKPGPTMVTNLDNAGQVIRDPRTADRGPYTSFCGFMVVLHGHIKLQ